MSIYHPRVMPNGSVLEIEGDVLDRLQKGDPTKGWEGDPNLVLAWHNVENRIELWRKEDDGEYRIVLRGRAGKRLVDEGLIDFLVAHDTRRGYNLYQDAIKANLAKEKEVAQRKLDQDADFADKFHWALMRDIGHYEGGLRKRIY